MPTSLQLVDSREFFASHYRPLADAARELAQTLVRMQRSTSLTFDIVPLLQGMFHICAATQSVLGITPSIPGENSIQNLLASLAGVVRNTGMAANPTVVQAGTLISTHVTYFEKRFQSKRDFNKGVFANASAKTLLREMCFNIANVFYGYVFNQFNLSSADPRSVAAFFDFVPVRDSCPPLSRQVIDKCRTGLEGWCSDDKTWLLYHLVRRQKPEVAVEIGIYGGRSMIPIAAALRDNCHGTVTGIEAWAMGAATEQVTNLANDFWWSCLDYSVLKKKFMHFIVEYELLAQTRIIEASSSVAHHCIGQIDFLHIDGNHSSFSAAQDVVNYFSKLAPGGIVVFDDINWPSTHPALEILMKSCDLLHVTPVSEGSLIPGCAAFRKI